jgi:hypothetical protein
VAVIVGMDCAVEVTAWRCEVDCDSYLVPAFAKYRLLSIAPVAETYHRSATDVGVIALVVCIYHSAVAYELGYLAEADFWLLAGSDRG